MPDWLSEFPGSRRGLADNGDFFAVSVDLVRETLIVVVNHDLVIGLSDGGMGTCCESRAEKYRERST